MIKLHEFLLTFFYSGKSKKAPGTVGSFVSVLFWLAITKYMSELGMHIMDQTVFWTRFVIVATIYASWAIPIYTKQFGQMDHQSIVLDETVGQVIALQLTFLFIHETYFVDVNVMLIHLFLAFALFRFFDITKPFIIGWADRMKTGFGVMLDDILAGLAAAGVLIGVYVLFV